MCFLRPSLGIHTPSSPADEQLMGMLGACALPQALGPPSQAHGGSWGAAQAPAGQLSSSLAQSQRGSVAPFQSSAPGQAQLGFQGKPRLGLCVCLEAKGEEPVPGRGKRCCGCAL